ncbi:nuclear transport factor 2 family protein [Sinimarinibacterium sp. CAU 1509]|uniref:nuclear transport factor 2 family protein n=1 Tax=Sinimarinibacterium sp. CAU 1509 TaxID=2562283 RepID=UPI0010ABA591|nr:nuclear transport factor 2 family protein [Sinimarinibacterium sp. CAU 1509]TJY55541.1 nuclear transport factor 2 family protein [Sinimarinibacterium sp. CAU 1509]
MTLPLEDIERIKRLKYRYCRCIDTANIDELTTLFTEDASVLYVGGSYRFEAEGRSRIIEALSMAFHSEALATHTVNHPEIDVTSPTTATGVWYLKDWFCDLRHKIITDGTALYRDLYVKRDGEWLIQRATYERIIEIVTPFTEPPNITAHWLAKHGRKLPA